MLYNIIGDIHGRTYWKNLVMDNAVNIFGNTLLVSIPFYVLRVVRINSLYVIIWIGIAADVFGLSLKESDVSGSFYTFVSLTVIN